MAADEVIADETSITGSIGVVGLLPTAQGAMDKLGVHTGGVATTWLTDAYDPKRALNPRFAQLVQSVVDGTYRDFTTLVAKARQSIGRRYGDISCAAAKRNAQRACGSNWLCGGHPCALDAIQPQGFQRPCF